MKLKYLGGGNYFWAQDLKENAAYEYFKRGNKLFIIDEIGWPIEVKENRRKYFEVIA